MAPESGQPRLVDKILALADALDRAAIPHAFGGALALAWCTRQARGTIDIDVNVFVTARESQRVFAAMPDGVERSEADLAACERDGQVRLWWGRTPVDLFANTTAFHEAAAQRAVRHEFAGRPVAFLGCSDLAVFKAFFNRSKDWVDLEEMRDAGALDVEHVLGVIVRYLGGDDERVARLRALAPA